MSAYTGHLLHFMPLFRPDASPSLLCERKPSEILLPEWASGFTQDFTENLNVMLGQQGTRVALATLKDSDLPIFYLQKLA